jgi:hypothetical protein
VLRSGFSSPPIPKSQYDGLIAPVLQSGIFISVVSIEILYLCIAVGKYVTGSVICGIEIKTTEIIAKLKMVKIHSYTN